MLLDNRKNGNVGDKLKEELLPRSHLSIITNQFSIHAFNALRKELANTENLRLVFSHYNAAQEDRTHTINGNQFERRLQNKLTQSYIAKQCAKWIEEKTEVRAAISAGVVNHNLFHIQQTESNAVAIQGSSGLTTSGLGLSESSHFEMNTLLSDPESTHALKEWFDSIWNNNAAVSDIKDSLLAQLNTLSQDNTPEFIYFLTLFNIFKDLLEDLDEENIIKTKTGFKDTLIWNKLYKNMLEAQKSVFEHVVYDSDVEEQFARSFEQSTEVKVYAKLPGWFKVDTPLGSYNPDWAVLVEADGKDKLYFVVETKGSMFTDALRPTEEAKIKCGHAHFDAMGNDVEFKLANDFGRFMEQVEGASSLVQAEYSIETLADLFKYLEKTGTTRTITSNSQSTHGSEKNFHFVVDMNTGKIKYRKFSIPKILQILKSGSPHVLSAGSLWSILSTSDLIASTASNIIEIAENHSLLAAIGLLVFFEDQFKNLSTKEIIKKEYAAVISVLDKSTGALDTDLLCEKVQDLLPNLRIIQTDKSQIIEFLSELKSLKLIAQTPNGSWYLSENVEYEINN